MRSCNSEAVTRRCLLFSCEFYKISKNTFPYETRPVAASGNPVN